MRYFLNLFSPETYVSFSNSDRDKSGFRLKQRNMAAKVQAGDRFICYLTKVSRWVGIFEVESSSFIDPTPIFFEKDDPFVIRFQVKPLVWLGIEKAIPIYDASIWNQLSFTRNMDPSSQAWTGKFRSSLTPLSDEDGKFLETQLFSQALESKTFPLTEKNKKSIKQQKAPYISAAPTIPIDEPKKNGESQTVDVVEIRESIRIQALLARIGETMGMKIWIPRNDRNAVYQRWQPNSPLPDTLPLNYDDLTLRTIEQIDVLWLKGHSIVRAFEVEHTTSIYSGILRMADLLALQPNMDIKLHIVAPDERKEKVFQEIRRPVFSMFENGPLSKRCSYIGYENVSKLAAEKLLRYLSVDVVDQYAEQA
ncbi:MAG: EVE domain-containing protein [Anaerolineaceae bacterium]